MQIAIIAGKKIINAHDAEKIEHVALLEGQTAMPLEEALQQYELGDSLRPPAPTWQQIREQRNVLLAASDWTQLPDASCDPAAWAKYRQALRDIPETFKEPGAAKFPDKPE